MCSHVISGFEISENMQSGSDDSTISVEDDVCLDSEVDSKLSNGVCAKSEVRLLDLYSGCGAMSTGLCLGAHLANVNLVTVSSYFLIYFLLFF